MPRFVVLHHLMPPQDRRASHWDFMLEDDTILRTWALAVAPSQSAEIPAEPLPAHRLDYLDYEGPVSRHRGEVRRWDRGTFLWVTREPSRFEVRLRGERLQGRVTLADVGGVWRFHWVADTDAAAD